MVLEPLRIFEESHFLDQIYGHIGVSVEPDAPVHSQEFPRPEDAVAQVGFGHGTKSGNGPGGGYSGHLIVGHMDGMNQTPTLVHGVVIQKPSNRPAPVMVLDLLDFRQLLGDVNMDRTGGMSVDQKAQALLRYGAQRMRGDPSLKRH